MIYCLQLPNLIFRVPALPPHTYRYTFIFLYIIQYTIYKYCTLYTIQCTLYTIQHTHTVVGGWHPRFEPIWAPDKQPKVFLNSVSILPRYSIKKWSPPRAAHRRDSFLIYVFTNKNLQGVLHTAETISAVCIIPLRWSPRCEPDRGDKLHTAEMKSKSSLVSGCFSRDNQVKSFYWWTHLSWKKRFEG